MLPYYTSSPLQTNPSPLSSGTCQANTINVSPHFHFGWPQTDTVTRSSPADDCYQQRQAQTRHSSTSSSNTSSPLWNMAPTFPPTPLDYHYPKRKAKFHAVLKAPTAITQKSAHQSPSITYLNRGQFYAIQLADPQGRDGFIQTELALSLHEVAHRRQALTFWKSWLGQHRQPHLARTVDLDACQSMGIRNLRYTSFDKIMFDWHGQQGATIFVRFHCLSTDFSRIKGVKGIPLRVCLTHQPLAHDVQTPMDHREESYCKIKLFRDKGAERKYKDDAKQLAKQMEKINYVGDPRDHPLWLMYHASASYTVFDEIPALDVVYQIPVVTIPPRNATHSPPKGGQRPFSSQPRLYHPYHTKPSRTTVVPTQLFHDVSTPPWQESLPCRLSSALPSYIGWHTNDSSPL
ncbi:hypothetical protein [Absidia glauca]|uniref:Grh/CP2 DB domain-containing protein n=1 Tax=Absidia glauca TaxID=4829 RepID=A0A163JWF3_ABSGL|nr:hypothetical protein [Absidia glauca]